MLKAETQCLSEKSGGKDVFEHWYVTDHPIDAVLADNYFLPLAHVLRPFDEIEIRSRQNGLVSGVKAMVTLSDKRQVVVAVVGEKWRVQASVHRPQIEEAPPQLQYVPGDAMAEGNPEDGWKVKLGETVLMEGFMDQDVAVRVARGDYGYEMTSGGGFTIKDPQRAFEVVGMGYAPVSEPAPELTAKWKGPTSKWCVLNHGEVIVDKLDRDTAHRIVAGDLGLPKKDD